MRMKKARHRQLLWQLPAVIVLLAVALALVILRHQADTSVTVTLPDTPVTVGDQLWDNRNAVYPLVCYRDAVYLPAPAARSLGLSVSRSSDAGVTITVNGAPEAYLPLKRSTENAKRSSAAVLTCPVTVAGSAYDNAAAEHPFLEYRGVVYIPLTQELCSGPLCIDYAQDSDKGISLRATGRLRGTPADEMPRFILHMGGVTPDGQIYTNSIEAAEHSYSCGYRWLELDFNWTSDGALVCIHDWGNWKQQLGNPAITTPTTLEEFERLNDAGTGFHSFTPAVLDDWLKQHPGAMIVTDVKDDNIAAMHWLAENYPDLRSRLIVQIYGLDEYVPIRALGFEHIILTMYRIPWEEYHDVERLTAFIRDTQILAITMAAEESVRDVFEALVATGIPVYVHTLDEPEDQTQWMEDGAYGVYTNYGDRRTN